VVIWILGTLGTQSLMANPMLTIDLPAEIETRLDTAAKLTGKTKDSCVRDAILRYLDVYAARRKYDAIKSGESDTVPLHKVMEEYGMEY